MKLNIYKKIIVYTALGFLTQCVNAEVMTIKVRCTGSKGKFTSHRLVDSEDAVRCLINQKALQRITQTDKFEVVEHFLISPIFFNGEKLDLDQSFESQGIRDDSILTCNVVPAIHVNIITLNENRRMYSYSTYVKGIDNIASLYKFELFKNRIFIFNGNILDKNSSFDSNGISNNDKLVALESNNNDELGQRIIKWKKETADQEAFNKKIDNLISNQGKKSSEVSRLKDSKLNQLENRKKWVRKSLNFFNQENTEKNEGKDLGNQGSTNLNFSQGDTPNGDALPILW